MSDSPWKRLVTVFDTLSAQVLVERLNAEGVPTRLRADTALLGVARTCDILVPAGLVPRARHIISAEEVSESELTWLATGELGPDRTESS